MIKITITILLLALSVFSDIPTPTIMTEDYPPFNYAKDNEVKGFATELVKEIQKRTNTPGQIKILPWNRAYKTIQNKDDHILYSMARTEEREGQFKWVGPIMENKMYLYKKRGSGVQINSIEDAKRIDSIGVQQNSNAHTFLKSEGFNNLDAIPDASLNLKKLLSNRVSLIPSTAPVIYHRLKQEGLSKDAVENTGVSLGKQDLYIAFSKNTDDRVVKQWQDALDDIKSDGTYDRLYQAYLD